MNWKEILEMETKYTKEGKTSGTTHKTLEAIRSNFNSFSREEKISCIVTYLLWDKRAMEKFGDDSHQILDALWNNIDFKR